MIHSGGYSAHPRIRWQEWLPWLAGIAYDATGSYTLAFGALVPLAILAAIALVTLGPYPRDEPA